MSKKQRWIAGSILAFTGLVIVAIYSLEGVARRTLLNSLNNDENRPYNYSAGDLDFHPFQGKLRLHDVELNPRAEYFFSSEKDNPESFVQAKAEILQVEGLKLWDLIFNNKISIAHIKVTHPEITYAFNPKNNTKSRKSIWSDKLQEAFVGNLEVTSGKLMLMDLSKDSSLVLDMDSVFVEIMEIRSDSSKSTRFIPFSYNDLSITFNSLSGRISKDYVLEVNSFHLSTDGSRMQIDHPLLRPFNVDSMNENELKYLEARAEKIIMDGWSIDDYILNGMINLDSLIIENPEFEYKDDKNSSIAEKSGEDLGSPKKNKQTTPPISMLTANFMEVKNLNGTIREKNVDRIKIADFDLEITKFEMDSTCSELQWPCKMEKFKLGGRPFTIELPDNYQARSKVVLWNSSDSSLSIQGISIKNHLGVEAYFKTQPHETDLYDAEVKEMLFQGINKELLRASGILEVEKLVIRQLVGKIHRDKTIGDQPFKEKFLPGSAIKAIPFPLTIKLFRLVEGNIHYNEKTAIKNAQEFGTVKFEKLEGNGMNISNRPETWRISPWFELYSSARFMGEVNLDAYFRFNQASKEDEFDVKGSLQTLNAASLNILTMPMAAIKFNSGVIKGINFEFSADKNMSVGVLDMSYSDIKVDVFKLEEDNSDTSKGEKKEIVSFLANTFGIKSNNDPEKNNYTQGKISFARNPNRGFFHYLFHSFKTGVTSTVLPKYIHPVVKQKDTKTSTE